MLVCENPHALTVWLNRNSRGSHLNDIVSWVFDPNEATVYNSKKEAFYDLAAAGCSLEKITVQNEPTPSYSKAKRW